MADKQKNNNHDSGVAIIGMACHLPGAKSPQEFWENILNKRSVITEIPSKRWDWRRYYNEDSKAPDKINSRWGGFSEPVYFDPLKFSMPPDTLYSIEPLQLLALHTVRMALADAGYNTREFNKETCSVILGAGNATPTLSLQYGVRAYLHGVDSPVFNAQQLPEWTQDSFAGTLINVLAGRIANRFDLGGINCTVDAACASSLGAVYQAMQELESSRCDMAISGGVDASQSPWSYLHFSKAGALSPTGACKPFDKSGNGTVISEGLCILILKRYADAVSEGDRIYAVIKGIGGASDGKATSISAPNPDGQKRALERAYAIAKINPATIELIEAHGTGTSAGDAAEIDALSSVFTQAGAQKKSCALGSVKSMIGHTKAASGAVGIMKTALALYYKTLPPTLGVTEPLEAVGKSPFFINTEARPWFHSSEQNQRRAGVTGIGFGGINFHAVLEEAQNPGVESPLQTWDAELVLIPGDTIDKIEKSIKQLLQAQGSLADIAFTLWDRIKKGEHTRTAIVANSQDDLSKKLSVLSDTLAKNGARAAICDPNGIYYQPSSDKPAGKIAFVFPGQGSQYPNMMLGLLLRFPELRKKVEAADTLLRKILQQDISQAVYPVPVFDEEAKTEAEKTLAQTRLAQPALGLCSLGFLSILQKCGVPCNMAGGHSFGEFSALYAAGALSEEMLLNVAATRGHLMTELTEGKDMGVMAAVMADPSAISNVISGIKHVWITNLNAPGQTMLSGTKPGIEQALDALKNKGIEGKKINVSGAFHSPIFDEVAKAFAGFLEEVPFSNPRIPVYANTNGQPHGSKACEIVETLKGHLIQPVLFVNQIESMYRDGARIFIEVGPKAVLCGLIDRILGEQPHITIPMDNPKANGISPLLKALAQITSQGIALDLDYLFQGRQVKVIDLANPAETEMPSKTSWIVDCDSACPLSATQKRKESVIHPELPPIPAEPLSDKTMLHFQSLMKSFLESQERVMMAYLKGEHATESVILKNEPASSKQPLEAQLLKLSSQPLMENNSVGVQSIAVQILEIVSARTGYPVDMLDLAADLEADLSIDSIKKVEILGAIQDKLFAGGKIPPDAQTQGAARLSTLNDIIQWVEKALPKNTQTALEKKSSSQDSITERLLEIVSARTGYPIDMLDLDANLEADLSIDSIKRVEILGAISDALFGGKVPDAVSLERAQTLRAIADGMAKAMETKPSVPLAEVKPAGVSSAKPGETIREVEAPPRFILRAVPSATPPIIPMNFDQSGVILITDDGEAAIALKNKLDAKGGRTLIIGHGKAVARTHTGYSVNMEDPSQCIVLAEQIQKEVGPVCGLVHLAGLRKKKPFDKLSFDEWNTRLTIDVKLLFCLAKVFAEDIKSASAKGCGIVMAATCFDGKYLADGMGSQEFDPGQMGISGIVKTLGLEWPKVLCKVIDFDSFSTSEERSETLIREMSFRDSEPEVGYHGGQRHVLRVIPEPLQGRPVENSAPNNGSVILITGGARGITAEIAKELAKNYQPTLLLAGLSPLPDEEDPVFSSLKNENEIRPVVLDKLKKSGQKVLPKEVEQEVRRLLRNREILANIKQMRDSGATVIYHSADVCDGSQMQKLINSVYQDHGHLDYVIHGAGIIEDNLIENKSYDSFCRVFDTKAKSVFWLSRLLRFESLKGLLLFTSVVGRFGNRGQTDYSAVNEVVDKVAVYLNGRHATRIAALNWGPWASSGMVSPGVERQLKERDIRLVSVAGGRKALDAELCFGQKNEVEIVIGDGLWRRGKETSSADLFYMRHMKWANSAQDKWVAELILHTQEHPYLFDHLLDNKVVLPLAFVLEAAAQAVTDRTQGLAVVQVSDFRVMKGIVFENEEKKLTLTLERKENQDTVSAPMRYDVKVALSEKPGFPTHRLAINVGSALNRSIQTANHSNTDEWEAYPFSMKTAYEKYLFHGPSLQVIKSISGINNTGIKAQFQNPQPVDLVKEGSGRSWALAPALLDGVSQLANLWLVARHQTACFPAGFASLDIHNEFPGGTVYCELAMHPYVGGSAMHVDVTLKSETGLLLAVINDFEFSCSKAFFKFGR